MRLLLPDMTSPHGNALLARRDSSREPCSPRNIGATFFRPVAVRGQVLAQDVVGSAGSNTGAAECVGQHNPSQPGKLRGWHLFIRQAKPRRPVPQVRGKVIGDCSHALATPLLIIREASIDDFVVPTLEERCCAAGHDCGFDTHAGCGPSQDTLPGLAPGSVKRSPQPDRDLSHAHGVSLESRAAAAPRVADVGVASRRRVQSIGR